MVLILSQVLKTILWRLLILKAKINSKTPLRKQERSCISINYHHFIAYTSNSVIYPTITEPSSNRLSIFYFPDQQIQFGLIYLRH